MSVYMIDSNQPTQACIIWMHGLGADSSDMAGLAAQLVLDGIAIRHVFIDAPRRPVTINGGVVMPAWYDIVGTQLVDRVDKQGIEQSETMIRAVIESQLEAGLTYGQLFLAGFSQGGAMALQTALNTPARLAGVIALSAYLPLQDETPTQLDKNTPFFLASGVFDPLVLPAWSQASKEVLIALGYKHCDFHQYPMEHAICQQEVMDVSLWLQEQIQGVASA